MILIKNQADLDRLKSNDSINANVIAYIEQYFHSFSKEGGENTPNGLSIHKSGVIVLVESTDIDLSKLVYLPSILYSLPEEVNLIPFTAEDGKQYEILHGLLLTNNEFGVDLIALKDDLHGELAGIAGRGTESHQKLWKLLEAQAKLQEGRILEYTKTKGNRYLNDFVIHSDLLEKPLNNAM